jgi:hypothetical protein
MQHQFRLFVVLHRNKYSDFDYHHRSVVHKNLLESHEVLKKNFTRTTGKKNRYS